MFASILASIAASSFGGKVAKLGKSLVASKAVLIGLAILAALFVGWISGRNSEAHKNALNAASFRANKAIVDLGVTQATLEVERAAAARQESERQSLEKQLRDLGASLPKNSCTLGDDGARRLRGLGRR